MDVFRDSNVYDFEAHRKLDTGRRPTRTGSAAPASQTPVIGAAWYHGDAIEAAKPDNVEARRDGFNVVPLRH